MQNNLPKKDYTSRRGELSAFGRATNSSKNLQRLIATVAVLGVVILLAAIVVSENTIAKGVLLLAVIVIVLGLILIWRFTKSHFIDPDLSFRKWIQQVCDGELNAGIDLPPTHRHFKELDFHTRNLTSSLRHLSTDMETLVDSQTKRLETQNRVLELLFQLTSDVVCELDLQSVLNTVCTHLSGWLDGADVGAYILENDNLKLRAVSGPNLSLFTTHRPASDLPLSENQPSRQISTPEFKSIQMSPGKNALQLPVFKQSDVVGMVEIVVGNSSVLQSKDTQRVFQTVSEQLSAFVLRDSAFESAHNARLVKERTQLGADLHDSLAQTLLATSYKVRMMRETLASSIEADVSIEAATIDEMINEANAELRGLIGEYRKPLSEHRPAEVIRNIIDDFNRNSEVEVFFQQDNPEILFTPREDTVVQRVIGEALNNARKYAKASMIRVYVRMETSGARSILIEDDGIGFCSEERSKDTISGSADQIGLSIMRDRALSIGANLTIESELEEGTRVFLKLPPLELSEAV